MDRIKLHAEQRPIKSKGYLKSLRQSGKVPAVLHGHKDGSVHIMVDSIDLRKAISTSVGLNAVLDLEIAGFGTEIAMVENLQRDYLKEGVYLHVDFNRISLDKKIEVSIPIVLSGQDHRSAEDGIISQPIREIHLMSSPTSIPESIHIDVSSLKIGDSIHLRDIELPEGCDAVTPPDEMLVSIMSPRVMEEEPAESEEEPAEPEVVAEATPEAEDKAE